MEQLTPFIEFSPIGIAIMSLSILFYFIRNNMKTTSTIKRNDLTHVTAALKESNEKLERIADQLEQGGYIKQDLQKKITYLYEQELKRR